MSLSRAGKTTSDVVVFQTPQKNYVRRRFSPWTSLLLTASVCAVLAGCDKTPPAPQPQPQPPGSIETISGRERIGWDQQAAERGELATFRYALYVDGTRAELADVSCGTTAGTNGFACDSNLPALSRGMHTLELAAFFVDGGNVAESARSAPLRVNVVPTSAAETGTALSAEPAANPVGLRIEHLANGLHEPTDTAFTPDGRLLIAERAGRVRIFRDGRLMDEAALILDDVSAARGNGLSAIAIDPRFDLTHFVYVIYTTSSRTGDQVFRLVRFRDLNDTLAERAVLLDDVPAPPAFAAAALRFGADGKLYAAFDEGADSRRIGDLSSYSGKILRLNADGSTPADQPASTPVYAKGFRSPHGLDWRPGTATLWIAGDARLRAVKQNELRSSLRSEGASYTLPGASSLVFYRGDLFPILRGDLLVGGGDMRSIRRIRFDDRDATLVTETELLVGDTRRAVRTLAVGPDGAIYFCSNDEVSRLVPDSLH